jgi:hypothetical protein
MVTSEEQRRPPLLTSSLRHPVTSSLLPVPDSTHDNWDLGSSDSWFAYLFCASDCTAFKVGFTCNPLQRLYSFNHRYFEGFDLHRSALLQLASCDEAREVEAALKSELAACRCNAPSWVLPQAGGYTEWFSAVQFEAAEDKLRSYLTLYLGARLANAFDVLREHLHRYNTSFEHWAVGRAKMLSDPRSFEMGPNAARETQRALRDWLDAYRYFDVPVFVDDRTAFESIVQIARHAVRQ